MIETKIKSIALKNREKIIKIRRQIHSNPELAFKEYKTSKLIKEELNKLNIEYINIAGTGVLATIKGKIMVEKLYYSERIWMLFQSKRKMI